MIPQIIYLLLSFGGFCLEWSRHGEPKTGKYNAISSFIAMIVIWILLYYGNFWNSILK